MDVLVGVALRFDERDDRGVVPHRPGVRAVVHLRLIAPAFQGLVEVAGEIAGIPGAGTTQGLDVVQRVVRVLRAGQRLQLRDPDVHLLRRFGIRRVEELEGQAGDARFGPVVVIGSVGEM